MQNPCKEVNVEMNDKGGQIAENCKTMMSATPSVQKHRDDLAAHAERAMNDLRLNTESVMYAEKLRLIARTRREQQARMDLVARECEALGATVAECGPPANRIRQFIFYVLCVVLAALSYVAVGVWALYLWGN
jgi:cytochrome c-type biogenesis protein CcmH/NrfG